MNECRNHASKVQSIVDSYKHANRSIQGLCKRISESLLVHIDSKRIYENNEVRTEAIYNIPILWVTTTKINLVMALFSDPGAAPSLFEISNPSIPSSSRQNNRSTGVFSRPN